MNAGDVVYLDAVGTVTETGDSAVKIRWDDPSVFDGVSLSATPDNCIWGVPWFTTIPLPPLNTPEEIEAWLQT